MLRYSLVEVVPKRYRISSMPTIPFTKMHGAGNDFVVIDLREHPVILSESGIAAMADRHKGIGCDQIVVIDFPQLDSDIRFRFYNSDGSESGACGNGTRCAASKIMREENRRTLSIETLAKVVTANMRPDGSVTVDMGLPETEWRKIPLAYEVNTLYLPINLGPLMDATGVNVGNPHCVFFVEDADAIDINYYGPIVASHKLFPESTNVEFVSKLSDGRLRMRVWERGVGVSLACGTGVCAALVSAALRGIINGRSAEFIVDGGLLSANWREDDHIFLNGPVATSFYGVYKNSCKL